MKIAVVLLNLGGPDGRAAIAPFLKNFFMDPAIIRAPWVVRFALSRLIAWRRSRRQAGDSYARLGNKSPLLDNTRLQSTALEQELNVREDGNSYTVHIAMRYWHPMSDEVAARVKAASPDHIVLLPLYPQFSTTTTGSSKAAWRAAATRVGLDVPTSFICCYPTQEGWIAAGADKIRTAMAKIEAKPKIRLLFSAHGLPEKIIKDGDPYQRQIEQTAAALVQALAIPDLEWAICYQSRVGPMKWIGPSIDDELNRAGADKVAVVVYPIAFVSEHVETLVELDHEYAEVAKTYGVPAYARAGTVMDHPDFIAGLAEMVRGKVYSKK